MPLCVTFSQARRYAYFEPTPTPTSTPTPTNPTPNQACLALLAPLLRWLPLVTHARLVLALWLQLPHLRTTTR